MPLTGSPGNTLIHETAKKNMRTSYTHTHTDFDFSPMSEWDASDRASNMTQVKENISLGYFRCCRRAGLEYVRVRMRLLWRTSTVTYYKFWQLFSDGISD